jgi:hypothetical protein
VGVVSADYSALVGRYVVAYHGGAASGPWVLVSIEDGWFVFEAVGSDRFTLRRRGTTLRPY